VVWCPGSEIRHHARADHSVRWLELAPGVGEPEAQIAGCALGQGTGEHSGLGVVVVVHLGRGLAGMGTDDAPDVLDEAALERDGR